MIMRVFQVSTHPGKEAEFGKFFHETAIPLMKRTPGIVSITPGAPRADSPTEFCVVMIWKDLESLKAFVGEDYESVVLTVTPTTLAPTAMGSISLRGEEISHSGGCRKSSPPGKCCHAGSKPLHCH